MATPREKYSEKMLETLVDYNDSNNTPLSNEKLQIAVNKVMAETEDQERDTKHNTNNVTMDNFYKSPVRIDKQRKKANVKNVRQISSNVLAKTIKEFKGLTIQPINDYGHYRSEEGDKEIDQKRYPKVTTHTDDRKKRKNDVMDTTNRKSSHKLLINMLVPEIIPATIIAVDQAVAEDSALVDQTLEAVGAVLPQEIFPVAMPSAAIGFKNPPVINQEDASRTHPVEVIGF